MNKSRSFVTQDASTTRRSILAAAAATLGGIALPFAGAVDSASRRPLFSSPREELLAYERIVGTTRSGAVWWWHFGEISLCVPRRGIIPVARVQTIAFSRLEWMGRERCRTHFTEVGCLLDLEGDELVSRWRNPLTGVTAQGEVGPLTGTTFVEGPGTLELAIVDDQLVGNTEIDRNNIRPLGVQWDIGANHVTCTTIQESAQMVIVQCNHAAGALRNLRGASVEASKHYTMIRAASAVGDWAKVEDTDALVLVRGYAQKGAPSTMVDQAMYDRLRALHPAIVGSASEHG